MAHKTSANYRTRQRKKAEAIIAASSAYSMDLESRIYSLERRAAAVTEWPDVIGGEL